MQFLYDPNASAPLLTVRDESYRYLFRVRRTAVGEEVDFRNLRDGRRYRYRVVSAGKREAQLELVETAEEVCEHGSLHLFWCVIDPRTVEKTLPMLNQIGVSKISFLYCDRSQKNFKPDMIRLEKILINSCQQCGRTDLMEIETISSLDAVLLEYADIAVLDFGGDREWGSPQKVLIGCEGGFSEAEREKLQTCRKIGLKTDLILKSETAAVAIASKLLI